MTAMKHVQTQLDEKTYERFQKARGGFSQSAFLREMIWWTLASDEEIEMAEWISRRK